MTKERIIRAVVSLLLALILVFLMSLGVMADVAEPVDDSNNEILDMNMMLDEQASIYDNVASSGIPLRTDGRYIWKVTSKTTVGHPYGSWRNGPSGKGPSTLSLTNSSGCNLSVSNTISGSYTSVADISNALNVSIGVSIEHSASYSVKPPKGKRYQIIYRPQYKKVKVIQTKYYRIDGYDTKTSDTKVSYVKIFENWDYSWKEIK